MPVPDIDTADATTLVEYLRDKRIYLLIDVQMMSVEVKMVYRIWEQDGVYRGHNLTEAVRLAARKAYADIAGVDVFWDNLRDLAKALSHSKEA